MAIKYIYEESFEVKGWFNNNQTVSGWFDRGFSEIVGGGGSTGQIKVFLGSWLAKPVKWYNGATWIVKPLKRYSGSIWVTTPY